LLGHIEDYCEKLYSIDSDDGIRLWGPDFRVDKQRSNGSDVHKLRDGGASVSVPSSATNPNGNDNSVIVQSKAADTKMLANLLCNPHLMRQSTNINVSGTNQINEETILEENNEAIIGSKLKRSRELNDTAEHLAEVSQPHQVTADVSNPKSTHDNNIISQLSHDSNSNTSAPMEINQIPKYFLSVAPGSQARREQ
jgi:hypothetical protein